MKKRIFSILSFIALFVVIFALSVSAMGMYDIPEKPWDSAEDDHFGEGKPEHDCGVGTSNGCEFCDGYGYGFFDGVKDGYEYGYDVAEKKYADYISPENHELEKDKAVADALTEYKNSDDYKTSLNNAIEQALNEFMMSEAYTGALDGRYNEGLKAGQANGYNDGQEAGYAEGYSQGMNSFRGSVQYDSELEEAMQMGYDVGYDDGYNAGGAINNNALGGFGSLLPLFISIAVLLTIAFVLIIVASKLRKKVNKK